MPHLGCLDLMLQFPNCILQTVKTKQIVSQMVEHRRTCIPADNSLETKRPSLLWAFSCTEMVVLLTVHMLNAASYLVHQQHRHMCHTCVASAGAQ